MRSTNKNSSKTFEEEGTSGLPLMGNDDVKGAENMDDPIGHANGQTKVNGIGKKIKLPIFELRHLSDDHSRGSFGKLSNAIENRNVEKLQNSMNGLSKYLY